MSQREREVNLNEMNTYATLYPLSHTHTHTHTSTYVAYVLSNSIFRKVGGSYSERVGGRQHSNQHNSQQDRQYLLTQI